MDNSHETEIIQGVVTHSVKQKDKLNYRSIVDMVLQRVGNVQSIGYETWSSICPCCRKNLTILSNPGGKQKVVFRCPSDCSTEKICSALEMSVADITIQEDNNVSEQNGKKTKISIIPDSTIAPKAKNDITTFVSAIEKHYVIRFNELSQRAEIFDNQHWRDFTETDEAKITQFCQDIYGISNRANLKSALLICQGMNKVNPIVEVLTSLVWDGKPRTHEFLHDVMKCDNNRVNREISQMIFTGGIRRAFEPGYKWDNVVVIQGHQGSGKSTIVNLLGMGYTGEIKTFSGKEAIEKIGGLWIAEIGELSAIRKAKDIEEIKAFISTQIDKYRPAYAHLDVRLPRRCIFIGTTNDKDFLVDRTGNRRFFPVIVKSNAIAIWKNTDIIKDYIRQAWAEAVYEYNHGTLPADYDHSIDDELNKIREEFQERDWKVDAFEAYLKLKKDGETVCCIELWTVACGLDKEKLTKVESKTIGAYMDNHPDWVRLPDNMRPYFIINGIKTRQRGWVKNIFQIR